MHLHQKYILVFIKIVEAYINSLGCRFEETISKSQGCICVSQQADDRGGAGASGVAWGNGWVRPPISVQTSLEQIR